jgi:folate-binding protein YgfZ
MAKQSPLVELHKRNRAVMIERDGWALADHFDPYPVMEYKAVQVAAGIFDLSHHAMFQVTGPDRVSFLQGMLSNDVRILKPFEGQAAALLNQQGKVIADVRVLCALNSIYLDFWEPLKEKIYTHLNRYLVADEVEISDPNDEWKMLSLQGLRAESIVRILLNSSDLPAKPNQHAMGQFEGTPVCVVRADRTGHDGFDLIVQSSRLVVFAERMVALGAVWVGERTQNILRIEAGIPRFGIDFDEETLLLEVGLEDSYSYTKGCYLGQEVVERIRSRGHVNKKLSGLLLDGNTAADSGDAIFVNDRDIGKITSSAPSFALNRPIALGYVHKDFWTPGTKLSIRHGSAAIPAEVTGLPFVANTPTT